MRVGKTGKATVIPDGTDGDGSVQDDKAREEICGVTMCECTCRGQKPAGPSLVTKSWIGAWLAESVSRLQVQNKAVPSSSFRDAHPVSEVHRNRWPKI